MIGKITLGQYYPTGSFLHRLDPRTKILCTLIFIVGIFFANTWPAYGLVAAFVVFTTLISKLPPRLIWKAIKPL